MTDAAARAVQPLRPDIEVIDGPEDPSGAPTWVLHDAFNNKYTRIGWLDHEIIQRWHLLDVVAIAQDIRETTTLDVFPEDVKQVEEQLAEADLLTSIQPAGLLPPGWKRVGMWRFPLVSPDSFLTQTLWIPRAVNSLPGRVLLVTLLLFSCSWIFRNWDSFVHAVLQMLTLESLPHMFIVLFLVKIAHELGHAWACRAKGLSVPSMGVAIFLFWPFMYTDTTSAWRLQSRTERAFISAAGVLSECVVAIFALALWCVLPDGLIRGSLLFVATSSLAISLLINANPFMRWDGYYVLSDLTGVENLQPRAFRLTRWFISNTLFGLGDPPPEIFPSRVRTRLIVYSIATWLYRIGLYLGMAAILFTLLFKAASILLTTFVIFRFVLLPVIEMLIPVFKQPGRIRITPVNLGLLCIAGLIGFTLTLPLDNAVTSTALVKPQQSPAVFTHEAGQIVKNNLKEGQWYDMGDVLVELESDSLKLQRRLADIELQQIETILESSEGDLANGERTLHLERRERQLSLLDSLQKRQHRQIIRAPSAGFATNVSEDYRPGTWISASHQLAELQNFDRLQAIAYVNHRAHLRLSPGAKARIVPDDPSVNTIDAVVEEIRPAVANQILHPSLLDTNGGNVVTHVSGDGSMRADGTWYEVVLTLSDVTGPELAERTIRGAVHLDAEPTRLIEPLFAGTGNRIKSALAF